MKKLKSTFKKFSEDSIAEVGDGTKCSPEAGHPVKKKKKSVICGAANGHKTKSDKFFDSKYVLKQKGDEHCASHVSETISAQTSPHLQINLTDATSENKRKRKKNDDKRQDFENCESSMEDGDKHCSKKLKLKSDGESRSDKLVVSSSSVEPGAFVNYRISPAMADKLRCMLFLLLLFLPPDVYCVGVEFATSTW